MSTSVKQDSTKEIRLKIEEVFNRSLQDLKIKQPSKKAKRLLAKAAKRLARQLKAESKEQMKKKAAEIGAWQT